jgi:hypothetical protein
MDPLRSLIEADQALSDGFYAVAASSLHVYDDWRVGGGFQPRNVPSIRGYVNGDAIAAHLGHILVDRMVTR